MGFTEPNFPRVEPEAFLKAPFLERVKTLTLNWVENGYGVPRMVHAIYIVKLVFFYDLGHRYRQVAERNRRQIRRPT